MGRPPCRARSSATMRTGSTPSALARAEIPSAASAAMMRSRRVQVALTSTSSRGGCTPRERVGTDGTCEINLRFALERRRKRPRTGELDGRYSYRRRQKRSRPCVRRMRWPVHTTASTRSRSWYDRRDGVLVFYWTCERCGAWLGELRREPYRPEFDPHGYARFLTVVTH